MIWEIIRKNMPQNKVWKHFIMIIHINKSVVIAQACFIMCTERGNSLRFNISPLKRLPTEAASWTEVGTIIFAINN